MQRKHLSILTLTLTLTVVVLAPLDLVLIELTTREELERPTAFRGEHTEIRGSLRTQSTLASISHYSSNYVFEMGWVGAALYPAAPTSSSLT